MAAVALAISVLAAGMLPAGAQTQGDGSSEQSGQLPSTELDGDGLLPDPSALDESADPGLGLGAAEIVYPNLGSQLSALAVAAAGADSAMGEPTTGPLLPDGTNSTGIGEPVLLTIQLDANRQEVLEFLDDNGVTPANVVGDYLEAYVPPTLLGALAQQTGVSRVRESPPPFDDRGTRTPSSALSAHGAATWHLNDYTGDGVKVGVIDTPTTVTSKDGFTGVRSLLGADLPSTVVGRCYTDVGNPTSSLSNCDAAGGDNHGTRVAASLMDIAPDAELYIANPHSWADFHSSVVWMHGQGVRIIVQSVSWSHHGAADGTSPISPSPLNTVKWASDNGITWVNSAGNYGKKSWYGPYADSDGDGYHEWSGSGSTADEAQMFQLPASASVYVSMRWDDTWGGSTKDLDLEVRYSATEDGAQAVVGGSADVQSGGSGDYPLERMYLPVARAGYYWVYAKKKSASAAPSWLQIQVFGAVSEIDHYSSSGTVTSPGDSSSPGVLAVGAANDQTSWRDPTFYVKAYSGRGPTPDGRTKPDVVAKDCEVVTSTSGAFCGTSQSAPFVAGLAALVRERYPAYTANQVADYLRTNAADHGAPGADSEFGYGFAMLPSDGLTTVDETCATTPLAGSGTLQGTWDAYCLEEGENNISARYYSFAVDQQRSVTIELSATADAYPSLQLRRGGNNRTSSRLSHSERGWATGGKGGTARLEVDLPAGDYTIEAAARHPFERGPFSLKVQGIPALVQSGSQISIAAGSDVTEGSDISFAVTASPSPSAPLTVWVGVAQQGNFVATTGLQPVTVATSGTGTLTVSTVDDSVDEADGTVTATVDASPRYSVSSATGAASVAVADNDSVLAVPVQGDDCMWTLTGEGAFEAEWTDACKSTAQARYDTNGYETRYYTFTLDSESTVTIDLEAKYIDNQLFLRSGKGQKDGSWLARSVEANKWQPPSWGGIWKVVPFRRSQIVRTLAAGDYTIEAATSDWEDPGSFTLAFSRDDSGCTREVEAEQKYGDIGNPGIVGWWSTASSECTSSVSSRGYARWYVLTLAETSQVTLDLRASWRGVDTYMYLRRGDDVRSGTALHSDDDGGDGKNSRISAQLDAGVYTIEATTYAKAKEGTFDLTVDAVVVAPANPVVSIAAGGDVTEGAAAEFTVTANPAPASDLDVSVTVTQSGDYGATAGARTVTVPTSGTATLSVATVGDDVDEADGSVTATLLDDADYDLGTAKTATVTVSDDDLPLGGYVVDSQVVTKVRALAAQTHHGVAHVNRWNRVLVAFGEHDGTGVTGGAMTKAQAQQMADQHSSPVWDEVVAELTALEAAPPPVIPVVSIAAGGDVAEGAAAEFTVTASPAPASDLDVSVTVTQSGDYGVTAGGRTVTVPTSGSVSLSVATTDDSVDEADGSVSAALGAGSGYTVSPSAGAATVAVADDDDPLPVVSVVASGGVTEGSAALFTVTASPPTAADLVVGVAVSAGGDFGVAAGTRAVTIPAGAGKPVSLACLLVGGPLCPGSTSLSVATVGDSTDEADGSVTVTLSTPTADAGYAVSSSAGAATVVVADDDDPPPGYIVDAQVVARVRVLAAQTRHGAVHVNRWNRVLVAFGEHDGTGVSGGAMDAAEAQQMADRHSSPVWDEVVAELTALEAAAPPPPPPPEPEVSVVSGGDVAEGAAAVFTVTAAPAPAADLDVTVTVTAGGDYGAATGTKTVTVPASGSVTVTVATADDSVDEADGSVTVTLNAGSGYTVSATAGAATAAVSDNDDPPPPPPPPPPPQTEIPVLEDCGADKPAISISSPEASRSDTTVDFEVALDCKPARRLMVLLIPVRDGNVGANTLVTLTSAQPTATVTVPIRGEHQLSLAIGWAPGIANRTAQGHVTFTD
ncbi:MAG: S8 family serine peptidase [Acidimicrobiaceae bacterium]|nr:S8 family serine peptidase [Acidimicrobiaceae bacterium]